MSLKRKAAHASIGNLESPETKRRRVPDDAIANATETPHRTSQVGLEFLEKLRAAKDKRDRLIATNFLTLPDPNDFPEYYQVIQLPIAIETIEDKLRSYEYSTVSEIESDLKRMISNAKQFNERTSEIHSDAEKIRKLVSNQMKDLNPAYADPNYQALPTPLPGESVKQDAFVQRAPPATPTPAANTVRPKRSVILRGPKDPSERETQTPASPAPPAPPASTGPSFQGKTFQQAQEMIIQELIDLKNDDGDLISYNFLNLPPRALKDYYATIRTPRSLKGLQKRAIGKEGHADPTGQTLMRSWDNFESEVSLIWSNARTYNEDGSEISDLAGQLERHFLQRLNEAKAAVPEPAQPKVKLKLSAKSPEPVPSGARITLNVGPRPSPSGVSVDPDALKRQQDLVKAGATGTASTPSRSTSNAPEPPAPTAPASAAAVAAPTVTALSQSPPKATNGIKAEVQTPTYPPPQSSTPEASILPLNGISATNGMPPPATTSRPPSASLYPPASGQHHNASITDNIYRPSGKNANDALITNLVLETHPSLYNQIPAAERIKYQIPPSDTLTQQSHTFVFPHTHSWIRLQPTIQRQAALRTTKLGVTANAQKVNPIPQRADEGYDARKPVYDVGLQPGITNRVEVWMCAGPARGAPKIGTGQDIEFERVTLLFYRDTEP